MIHVGGYYTKTTNGVTTNKLGGTYGCFGVVSSNQVFKTEKEALKLTEKVWKEVDKKEPVEGVTNSNLEMNKLVEEVNSAKKAGSARNETSASDIKVTINKRDNVSTEFYCK